MLQLKAECVQPLQQLIREPNKDEIVTCIFDDNVRFEQLDETQLLPKDDSIMIISSSITTFNLSRLYYHYAQNNDLIFKTIGNRSTAIIDNDKYTIQAFDITYVSLVRNHEILQRRINVMKQLIDIIKKLH